MPPHRMDLSRYARHRALGSAHHVLVRDYSVTPLSRRRRQIVGGVMGMSTWRTPRCQRASTTALAMAAGAPTVADSPTPFAPSGWCGDGVTVWPVSHLGVSTAVGSR